MQTFFLSIFLCSYNDEKPKDDESPSKYFVFEGADVDVTYTVKVTLVLNGKTIASSQKTIKSVTKKTEDEELGIKEYIQCNDDLNTIYHEIISERKLKDTILIKKEFH